MSYSYTDQRGNGVARSFNFGFVGEDKGYIRATDIQVFTSNDGLNYQATSGWSLSGTNQITFLTAPANGLYVRIRRVVDKAKPFSKFDRSVTLDMLSLNNSFIQMLEVVHELMDGFYDDTFFFKQSVSMGGHNLTNLAQATQAGQAVRYEEWKNHEDRLTAVENDLTGVSSRTVPYYYIATGGETRWDVQGRTFNSALVFINGVLQFQSLGAFSITNNGFNFAEPLRKGDEVYALVGSYVTDPDMHPTYSELASSSGAGLIGTLEGKTVQQDSQSSGLVRGNDGVKYAVSGCAVRRDTSISPSWAPVSDSAHIPINVTSVVGGVDVEINYKGNKIGSLVAGPDESLARDGALVGASVASNKAYVSIGAPCSFSVDLTTKSFEFDNHYFDQIRFGVSIGDAGNVTLTHPGLRTMLHPIIRYVAPNSSSKVLDVHYQNKITGGVTGVFLVGDVEGTISYNGTSWVLGSCDQWVTSDLTFTWDATKGELTVAHPVLLGSPELVLTPMYLGTPITVSGLAAAGNGFKVQFNKVVDGVPPTTPNSGLGFYFSRGKNGIRKNPQGKLLVHLGHVQVNCDHVDYPGGNFWFNATMQD